MRVYLKTERCALCGHEKQYKNVSSYLNYPSSELDGRPLGSNRNAFRYKVQLCPHCNYVNYRVSAFPYSLNLKVMEEAEYQSIASDPRIDLTAKAYFLWAMVYESNKNNRAAGALYLKAAWAYDDCLNKNYSQSEPHLEKEKILEKANEARKLAARLLIRCRGRDMVSIRMVLVDIYRRYESFDKAKNLAQSLLDRSYDQWTKDLMYFQLGLIANKDSSPHKTSEVPHVVKN